jgi:hypothetical protein
MMVPSILPSTWDIPQSIRRRLGNRVGRQRAMTADGHLLLVMHAPPTVESHDRVGRFFWRNPQGEWKSNELGNGIRALSRHVEQYEDLMTRLDRQEDEASSPDDHFQILEQLTPLYRATRNMHMVLQEGRKACPDDVDLINLRDRAYALERSAELLYEGTRNVLEFSVAKRAEEQARSSFQMEVAAHRLNLLAAFFFPLVTLTAIFGVNLEHGFESYQPPWGFLTVIAIGLALGIVLAAFVNRRRPERRAADRMPRDIEPRSSRGGTLGR